ncbi:DUF4383 domain-containing protein [Streptomyces peucetius]|uniref:DUF4383 domain-containing protein n=1 Tax=Streptomyces peucetius TaxID=1950 RepID=A0ABY6IIF5_STRPE|nr:DUF4383 domain-containing protein [Streptomyces peucetius]UYQ66821.1 DUF4383 domain-containing protein [Streptomyces peucetius]
MAQRGGARVHIEAAGFDETVRVEGEYGFVPLNAADNWLHFALGIGMVALGTLLARPTTRTRVR